MKRIFACILLVASLFTLAGCESSSPSIDIQWTKPENKIVQEGLTPWSDKVPLRYHSETQDYLFGGSEGEMAYNTFFLDNYGQFFSAFNQFRDDSLESYGYISNYFPNADVIRACCHHTGGTVEELEFVFLHDAKSNSYTWAWDYGCITYNDADNSIDIRQDCTETLIDQMRTFMIQSLGMSSNEAGKIADKVLTAYHIHKLEVFGPESIEHLTAETYASSDIFNFEASNVH